MREAAAGILEEMSQNLQLGAIRLMSYTLSKVFKRLYSSIYVNMEGLNRVGTDHININHKTFCYVRNELQHLSIPFLCVLLNLS